MTSNKVKVIATGEIGFIDRTYEYDTEINGRSHHVVEHIVKIKDVEWPYFDSEIERIPYLRVVK